MREKFVMKVKWWLPENSGKQEVYGELHYEPNGKFIAILEDSLFGTKNIHESDHNISLPLVYGMDKDMQCISLVNVIASEFGRTGWITMELYPEYVLIGKGRHFAVENMGVMNFNFCLNGFGSFFRGYKNRLVPDHSADEKLSFHYSQPKAIEIIDDEEKNIYFYFSHQYSGLNEIATGSFTFKERIYLNISWRTPKHLNEFVKQLKFYSDFFRFFSQEILSLDHVNLFVQGEEDDKPGFRFIYKQHSDFVGKTPSSFHALLSYKEIQDDLSAIMKNWIEQRDFVMGGLSLYMQTMYARFHTPAQLFLNLVFAIETFHKTFFSNKTYLSDRLLELISQNETILQHYDLDKQEFAEKVNKQRNYLAHNHSLEDHSLISVDEYKPINTFLKMIFELSFLRQIGVSETLLEKMIKRNDHYETVANLGGTWLQKKK